MSLAMLRSYVVLAVRVLRRRPFFTAVSLFGIAVTLGVLLVATAIVDHLFGPHVPESRIDRMLTVTSMVMSGPRGSSSGSCGWAFLERVIPDLPGVEAATIFDDGVDSTFVEGRRLDSFVKRTDAAFWSIFDFEFVAGGPFTVADDAAGAPVAVVNRATARRVFGRDDVVGEDIPVFGRAHRVVGVVDDVPIVRRFAFGDVWIPLSTAPSTAYRSQWRGDFAAVVLLAPGADRAAIKREFQARVAGLQLPDPASFDRVESWLETHVESISRELFGHGRSAHGPALLRVTFLVGALLFMLLPAVNLVNLNLSRILERAGEIGVRKSFGASSAMLVGQFVVENVVLTAFGTAFGLAGALVLLWALNEAGPIPYAEFGINLRVLLYGGLLALAFALLSGAWPAWRMSRLHPVTALRGGTR